MSILGIAISATVLLLQDPQDPQKTELPVLKEVVVVTGSRSDELQTETAQKVDALTRSDLQRTGKERLGDVLSQIPGVMTRRGSTATVAGEQIQGIDSRQVLVLQDGLPVVGARGIKSGAINLFRQGVGRMQQVEVAKGAGSPLFGTDAIGGVINMITREPSQPLEGGVSLSGGTLGALDGRYDLGTRLKKLSLFGDFEHHRMDQYRLIPNSPTTVGPDWRRYDGMFKARYNFTDKLAAGFTANVYDNREYGRSASETGLVDGLTYDSMKTFAAVIDWVPGPRTTVQGRGYIAHYDEDSQTNPLGQPTNLSYANLNQKFHRLDSTVSHQFGSYNLLQGGVEWSQDNYRGVNRLIGDNAGQQVTFTDVWLNDRFTYKRLTGTLGGRFHSHSMFGSYAVPRLGLVYKLTGNWVLRGSFGKGFRAPDLGQLYYRFANPASFYQVIGNPRLEPEVGASWQAGTAYSSRRLRGGVSFFRNNVRNLIDSSLIGTPATVEQMIAMLALWNLPPDFASLLFLGRQTFLYRNLGKIHTEGFELDGEWMIGRGFRARGAYTYLSAKDDNSGVPLTQRHRHQGFGMGEYVNQRWGLITNIRGTFFSNWLLNAAAGTRGYGYGIWDLYASKQIRGGLQAFGSIDNLGNSRDQKLSLPVPAYDRPDYGRMWRLGMRYNFHRSE